MAGEVVADRYELEQLVGAGGMSSVFRAHDRVLERTVALKVLHERLTDEDEYVERFRREAQHGRRASRTTNIVAVIDRGEHDGRPFIVFEYIAGENLKQLVDRDGPAAGRAGARARRSRSRAGSRSRTRRASSTAT